MTEQYKGINIPIDWKVKKLKDAVLIKTGQVDPKKHPYSNMYHVGLVNIEKQNGRLLDVKTAIQEGVTSGKYLFNKGDVLFGKIRPELAKVYYAEFDGICSADIYPLKETEFVDTLFLKYAILDNRFYQYSISVSMRTGLPKMNREDLGGYELLLPPKEEQKKIASILSTWDRAIELKEKLLQQKKEKKKGLMQKLLTGELRLPGFDGKWVKIKVGKLISEITEKSTVNNQYEVLSVTKNGIVSQNEHFKRQIASENNVGYKVIRKNNLVFSTMNLWMGSLDVLTDFDIGIVSPAYKVFKFYPENIIPSFAKYFMLSEHMIWLYNVNSEQGASIVRRNLDLKALLNTSIKVPDINEQKAIAKVLMNADREIKLLENELELNKQQKKGLMQLLLTGKVRVKV